MHKENKSSRSSTAGNEGWAASFVRAKDTLVSRLNKIGFLKSVWLFPSLLAIVFVTLVASGIHGSSIGIYHEIFYGDKDDALVLNKPRTIRSDEWLVGSQLEIAQANSGFNVVNKHLGNGQDVALLGDAPYYDWSIAFKPQNLGFLILPQDNAFAFHWWFMAFAFILSAYFFAYLLSEFCR